MLDIGFWLLYITTPIITIILLRAAGERITKISIVNVTVIALIMFSILGTFPLFYFLDEYRYSIGVNDQTIVLKVLFYSSINIFVFILGVIFTRKVFGIRPIEFDSSEIKMLSQIQWLALITIFFLCVIVLLLYLQQIDRVAIFITFTESISDAKAARSDMGNSFAGKYHWYKLFMHDIGKLVTFSVYAHWLITKNRLALIGFISSLIYSLFVAIMATEKGPAAWLLIGLFMVYFLVNRNGSIPFRKIVPFILFLLGGLILGYIFFMGSDNVFSAIGAIFSRAFSGSISPAYYYLEFFPAHQEFLLGRTFPNPGGILPYEPYLYTIEVMNWKFPYHLELGIVGTMPTVFWGEAYANFGVAGIPIIAFIMGCIVSIVSYVVSKLEINPLSIGFYVWLILMFKNLANTGFSGYFYNVYILFVSMLVLGVLAIRGYLRVRRKRSHRIV
ncbi:O-antigen polymerase [Pseudidiomarina aestuarii]|uniref:O-antigen polymerase n=1 Tax=Pseudidiomarina aestuarii TaxID=624146 RepID=UPI003A973FB5